jgi:hypothetical protein
MAYRYHATRFGCQRHLRKGAAFRQKASWKVTLMRNSSFGRSDSVGRGARIAIGIAVLILLGVVGLVFMRGSVQPPRQQTYEQVLPDAQFPH